MLPRFNPRGRACDTRSAPSSWSWSRHWPIVPMGPSVGQNRPVGPTHAVDAATEAVACGIKADGLDVLDQVWEEGYFVEKCPGCFAAVVAQS
jgi:hypothetical protein